MKTLQLLEYSQFLRHKYLETLSKLPWEEVSQGSRRQFPFPERHLSAYGLCGGCLY